MAKSNKSPLTKLISVVVVAVVALLGTRFPILRQLIGLETQDSSSSTEQVEETNHETRTTDAPVERATKSPTKTSKQAPAASNEDSSADQDDGLDDLMAAYDGGRSDVMVTVGGTIRKSLPDDNDGSRHQKFIVRFENGHTVLVAHNIDLAPRVPLREGDHVQIRGEYEWSDQGGVLHWTHHDPMGRHPEGWIRHEGKTYE